jgi:ubiquinone/menaquinone biosynthesis C-methylase UbiE
MKKVLNVGGNNKTIPLPRQYADFEHVLLDIDPKVSPDIVCDARMLMSLESSQFEAIYCSHNLEHYYRHDVQTVLSGFLHLLKDGGVAQIIVPDVGEVMRIAVQNGLDIDDVLYQSPIGPIMILDVLFGYSIEIERSKNDFYAHKTGFTQKSLLTALFKSGFTKIYSTVGRNYEINALAFKGVPNQSILTLFDLPLD